MKLAFLKSFRKAVLKKYAAARERWRRFQLPFSSAISPAHSVSSYMSSLPSSSSSNFSISSSASSNHLSIASQHRIRRLSMTITPVPYIDLIRGKRIGGGSSGEVYEAYWEGKKVAIKQLKVNVESFLHEAEQASHLNSDRIVRLLGFCAEPYCLILEYMQCSLEQFLKQYKVTEVSWSKRYEIALDMAQGLDYLHSQSVIHRDLKSSNVLFDGEHFKISDFGFTIQKSDHHSDLAGICGTIAYMAPELIAYLKKDDEKDDETDHNSIEDTINIYSFDTDAYALGILFWELATHEEPFADLSSMLIERYHLIMDKVLSGYRPKIPEKTPVEFKNLINLCWDKNPSARADTTVVMRKLNGMLRLT